MNIDQASEITNTSVPTLPRRLATEQKTYTWIVQQVRAEMACGLLERTDLTICDIAGRLGYGNQGDFTRFFHRWAGVSPSVFRKHRRS